MQSPTASDPSFKAFLDKLQEQNNRSFIAQLVQLKAEREIAGEDNDKREEQLDSVISSLGDVRSAVTGVKLDIDLTPLVNIGENQTKLLEELSKEASLTRKLTEGSVEYDKEAAQYRNTSGRDIESKVSGKTSKDGGFLDFETARDTLSGQGKRVREDNALTLKPINYTPGKAVAAAVGGRGSPAGGKDEKPVREVDTRSFFEVFKDELKAAPGRIRDNLIGYTPEKTDGREKKTEVDGAGIEPNAPEPVTTADAAPVSAPVTAKPQVTGINPESDNIRDSAEIAADYEKEDIELSKQMLVVMREQLASLKTIQEALAPGIPVRNKGGKAVSPGPGEGSGGGGGGPGLGDMLPGAGALGKGARALGRGAMSVGKAVLPYALPAAAMVATGAAVDYGLGKLGVGKDKEGNDLKIDEKQDDANWNKMSFGQKVQSGVGRGIEKAGSALFLDNMSREAQADRVKNETEYFKDKDFVDSSGAQDDANWNKMSLGKKILSGINRGGEKLSLFDSTKTTAARIRKETEELNKDAPGAATKEALAPAPGAVTKAASDPAPGAATKEALAAPLPTVKEPALVAPATIQQKEENVTGDPGAKNPARPQRTKEGVVAFDKAYSEARSDGKSVQESKEIGNKARNTVDAAATPVVEQKFVDTAAPGKAAGAAMGATPGVESTSINEKFETGKFSEADFMRKDPANFKKYKEFKDKRQEEIAQNSPFFKLDEAGTRSEAEDEAGEEAAKKFQKEINASKAGDVKVAIEKTVSGGPGAKNPVVEKMPVETAAPGAAAAVAMGAAAPVAVKKEAGPNWTATLKDYKSSTPVDNLESQYPGIKAKFIELANNSTPRTDNFQSIETHEDVLKTKALKELTGGKGTASAKPGSVTPTDAAATPGAKPIETISGAGLGDIAKKPSTGPTLGTAATPGAKPIETISGQPRSLEELAKEEAKKYGRTVPDIDDYQVAQDEVNKGASLGERVKSEATRLGIKPGKGVGSFEGGVLTKMVDKDTGKEHDIEVSEKDKKSVDIARKSQEMNENSGRLAAAASRNMGSDVNRTSTENIDMGRETGRGGANNTIVSNNVNNNNTTKFVPMMPSARPEQTGSALDRYTNRISVFY